MVIFYVVEYYIFNVSIFQDYMEDVNGKEISLQYVTVKVPGQKPRGSKSIITTVPGYNGYSSLDIHDSIGGLTIGK